MKSIEVKNLSKHFKSTKAVDDISFYVNKGECFGLLGPNGAGKTTTVNILSTLLKPTLGNATVAGYDVLKNKNEVRNSIGMVFQEPALDSKLTGKENLEFHAMMYGIPPKTYKKRIDALLDLVELKEKQNTLVQNYSGGMKRRLEIARGLIQKPKVLFLDEPTLGLDSQTRRRIWDYIKGLLSEKDISIILTTHYMDEADYLCDRIAIIDNGKIIALGTPRELKDSQGGDVLTLEVENETREFIASLSGINGIRSIKEYQECPRCLSITLEKAETKIPEVLKLAQDFSVKVASVSVHKISLEDVFLNYTGRTIKNTEEREKVW
ncbi:MAG: ATP-binding cassette domain-containing protein [Candidatus Margulisiibacteriota bacterium]